MMLLYVLTIFLLIHLVSSTISCYDCSLVPSTYNYIINAENIPTEIKNCQVTVNHTQCRIEVRWYLTTNMTEIDMLPDDSKALTPEHTLHTVAAMSGIGVIQQIQNSLYYFCSTDRCNDANQFKRILESLILTNRFTELEDLLRPTLPFVGQWCLLCANQTDEGCNSPVGIDPKDCKQCSAIFTHGNTMTTICASCFTDDIHEEYLEREIRFNISDRTIIDRWAIHCRSENCNGLNTGQRINEKSMITFDFNKFLYNNASSKQTMSLFLFKIALFFMTCIIKTFY